METSSLLKADLKNLIKKLKYYHEKTIYKLDPEEFADFMRLKANLNQHGIIITSDLLNLPEDTLFNLIEKQLELHSSAIDKLMHLDTTLFDEDRANIRKSLFATNMTVQIKQAGKMFNVALSSNLQHLDIIIPSMWELRVSQTLLLNLYDKEFKDVLPRIDTNDIVSIVKNLIKRYNNYAQLKKLIELDLLTNNIKSYLDEVLEIANILKKYNIRNHSTLAINAILIYLAKLGILDTVYLKTLLGYRKRLVNIILQELKTT